MSTSAIFVAYYFGDAKADLSGDSDGDGVKDFVEYFLGTDPTKASASDAARFPKLGSFVTILKGHGGDRHSRPPSPSS